MEVSQFEADRMDLSTQAGEIKKFSYMPTPEISVIPDFE